MTRSSELAGQLPPTNRRSSPILPQAKRGLTLISFVLATSLLGCRNQSEPGPEEIDERPVARLLRVAVVDDPDLAAIVERQWKARTEGEIDVRQVESEQLQDATRLSADVIIYPSAWLGTLAERELIVPLSAETIGNPQLDLRGTFDLQRVREVNWGEQPYAVTFGSPQLVLMYRSDLFAQLGLKPPETWDEYARLVAQLQRDALGESAPPEGQPWSAVAEPWAPGWAARVLLARAAAYARHPSQYSVLFELRTGEPLIAGEPFQRALKELVDSVTSNVAAPFNLTPAAAKRALLAGQTAMAWCWASRADAPEQVPSLPDGAALDFAELPGADSVYNFAEKTWDQRSDKAARRVPLLAVAGRLGSVTREAKYPRDAADMLCWLSGKQWGAQIAPVSPATTLYRPEHVNLPKRWVDECLTEDAAFAYANLVATTQSRGVYVVVPRVPGWTEHLSALDTAVKRAVDGEPVEEVLEDTAQQWRAITARQGAESQRAAFYRDLGLEP